MNQAESVTEESLCNWMIETIARQVRVDAASLGPASAFEDLGLSSLAAVTLATELSDAFGIDVDALVTWDYPTIGEVAKAIASGQARVLDADCNSTNPPPRGCSLPADGGSASADDAPSGAGDSGSGDATSSGSSNDTGEDAPSVVAFYGIATPLRDGEADGSS